MCAVVLGIAAGIVANRTAPPSEPAPGRWLFICCRSIRDGLVFRPNTASNQQRSSPFYTTSAATYPIYLPESLALLNFGGGDSDRCRYMVIVAGMVWILPPGPAEARSDGNHVEHFVPLPFPLLLIAIAIDLLRGWIGHGRGWLRDWLLVRHQPLLSRTSRPRNGSSPNSCFAPWRIIGSSLATGIGVTPNAWASGATVLERNISSLNPPVTGQGLFVALLLQSPRPGSASRWAIGWRRSDDEIEWNST